MKSEYYILCKYLSMADAGNDKKLKEIYDLEFGLHNMEDNFLTYMKLYFRDTTYFIFKRDPLLRKKLIFLCAMLEVSSYAELLIPSKRERTFIEYSISLGLTLVSKAQSIIYRLFSL